jgi:hypothetical protein
VMLANADATALSAGRCHTEVRTAVAGRLAGCRVVASAPDLAGGIELVFHQRGDRLRFARQLAARGIPSTWNYYPLHRMPAYAPFAHGSMAHADALWPRVLTVPKQPQHRLRAATLARALLDADRVVFGGGRDA